MANVHYYKDDFTFENKGKSYICTLKASGTLHLKNGSFKKPKRVDGITFSVKNSYAVESNCLKRIDFDDDIDASIINILNKLPVEDWR